MRKVALAGWVLAAAVSLSGCRTDFDEAAYHCASSDACRMGQQQGFCETSHLCSVFDATCRETQHRYAPFAGALSGACVVAGNFGGSGGSDGSAGSGGGGGACGNENQPCCGVSSCNAGFKPCICPTHCICFGLINGCNGC